MGLGAGAGKALLGGAAKLGGQAIAASGRNAANNQIAAQHDAVAKARIQALNDSIEAQLDLIQEQDEERQDFIEQFGLENVFGRRPDPVDYDPLYTADPGYAGIAGDTIAGNLANLPAAEVLTGALNDFFINEQQDRVTSFDPLMLDSLQLMGQNANLLNQGVLPFSDVEDIVSDGTQLNALLGTAGTSRPRTSRDLGMTRLQLMSQLGPNLTSNLTNNINSIAPPGGIQSPAQWMLSPSQTVPLAVGENQFNANFQQGQNLLAAMADPGAVGQFDLLGFRQGQQSPLIASQAGANSLLNYGGPLTVGQPNIPVGSQIGSSLLGGISNLFAPQQTTVPGVGGGIGGGFLSNLLGG